MSIVNNRTISRTVTLDDNVSMGRVNDSTRSRVVRPTEVDLDNHDTNHGVSNSLIPPIDWCPHDDNPLSQHHKDHLHPHPDPGPGPDGGGSEGPLPEPNPGPNPPTPDNPTIDLTNSTVIQMEGVMGPPGRSAYALAVQEGFKGTLDEWLDSLKAKGNLPPYDPDIDVFKFLKIDGEGNLSWQKPNKVDVGLSKVDNTSDKDKPLSDAAVIEFEDVRHGVETAFANLNKLLSTKFGEYDEADAEVKGQINDFIDQLTQFSETIDLLRKKVNKTNDTLTLHDKKILIIAEDVIKLSKRLDASTGDMEERIDEILQRIKDGDEQLQCKVDSLEELHKERIEALNQNLNLKVESVSDNLNKRIDQIAGLGTEFNKVTTELRSLIDKNARDIVELFSKLNDSNDILDEFECFKKQFQTLKANVATLASSLDTFREQVTTVNERIDNIHKNLSQQITSINQSLISKIDNNHTTLTNKITQLSNKIDQNKLTFTGRLDTLTDKVTRVEKDIDDIKDDLSQITDKIGELDGIDFDNYVKVDELATHMNDILNGEEVFEIDSGTLGRRTKRSTSFRTGLKSFR